MKTVMINEYTKVEIEGNMVQYFELMGNRWVAYGPAERWSTELIKEEFKELN